MALYYQECPTTFTFSVWHLFCLSPKPDFKVSLLAPPLAVHISVDTLVLAQPHGHPSVPSRLSFLLAWELLKVRAGVCLTAMSPLFIRCRERK